MVKFIILASLVVCCVAAPTSQQVSNECKEPSILLQRPSPINPDVLSDPKPDEKIIKITDSKEVAKHKREAEDDPYDHISRFAPTAQPARQVEKNNSEESDEKPSAESDSTHHRQKREKEEVKDTEKIEKIPADTPTYARKAAVKKDIPNYSSSHSVPPSAPSKKSAAPKPAPAGDLPNTRHRRQVDPHLIGAAAVGVTPLISHEEDKEPHDIEAAQEISTSEELVVPTVEPDMQGTTQVKRDIPVPLVPKYHHPEESPKSGEIQEKNENTNNSQNKQQSAQHNRDEHHHTDDDSKSNESNESDEDSKEKTPATPIQYHQPIQHLADPQLTQHHQSEISAQPALAGEVVAEHDTPIPAKNNAPTLEQLGSIKPTQIIAYETPASENNIAIKHPVPVAELFSRPKE